jgi:hypothetical protein
MDPSWEGVLKYILWDRVWGSRQKERNEMDDKKLGSVFSALSHARLSSFTFRLDFFSFIFASATFASMADAGKYPFFFFSCSHSFHLFFPFRLFQGHICRPG